jgi:hypothetical protein
MKKQIPLTILEALQPIVDANVDLIKVLRDTNSMFHLVDKDESSDFYFKVTKQEHRNGNLYYLAEYKPKDKNNVNAHSNWLSLDFVQESIKKWMGLIFLYNQIHTIYDDPILKSNQDRFEKQFELLDEDSDKASFNLDQQIFIDDYLTSIIPKLNTLKASKDIEVSNEIDQLINDATQIKNVLTVETKQKIIQRLARFWAKAQIIGLDIMKEIFVNVAAELTKKILIG